LEDNWRREIFKLLFGFIAGGFLIRTELRLSRVDQYREKRIRRPRGTPLMVADYDDKKWLYQREEYGLAAASAAWRVGPSLKNKLRSRLWLARAAYRVDRMSLAPIFFKPPTSRQKYRVLNRSAHLRRVTDKILQVTEPIIHPVSSNRYAFVMLIETRAKVLKDCLVNADEVKRLRKRLGYTQVELAKVLGVHKLTVSAWEIGRRNISRPTEIALKSLPKNPQKQRQQRRKP
jgi:DNA-binding transcriptional regulator YiaG